MSLYSHTLIHEDHGLVKVAYGYDAPMQEFFIIAERIDPGEREDFDLDELTLFSISNKHTIRPRTKDKFIHSNEELADILKEFAAPEEYHTAMRLGIPF